ncbi:hypothetical protein [Pseudoalteromonas sp. S3431]|uniref:hypothetical protein n=1 Tax=Pseudoalteromonas sp. S3431 TaxID=579537 RepID=UPI0004A12DB2|nr:hypothetical protein [Pseudoalteromonas sp. S3431]KDC54721.1 hypothetical protein DO88_07370 [Pseudoalteromonas sp. S3431]
MNKSNDNGNGNKPTKLPNRNRESVSKNNDNAKIPALIIGGALLGNLIAPGVGGAIVGGALGGFLGNSSKNNSKGK